MRIKKIIKGIRIVSYDVAGIIKREIDYHRVKPAASTLFLTYRCNSRCRTCTFWKRPRQEEIKKEIGFNEWKIIIDRLYDAGIRVTEIFGGNVLLRKELLIAVLRYLRERNFTVHLPTNQIGLDDEIAETIAECVDAVYISTDGVGEYQDAIRGQEGASRRVENTITKLLRMRRDPKSPPPRLICNTTVSRFNIDILEQILEYASGSGFDEIHFEYAGEMTQEDIDNSIIDGLRPSAYLVKQEESILIDHVNARLLKDRLRRLKCRYASEDIRITTINIDSLSAENLRNGTIPHRKCYVERNEVTVDPSGNIVACPFFNNYITGSLLNNSFQDVWNNERHRNFRRHQNSGDIAMCRHCILGVQRNPSFFRSLKRIYYQRVPVV